MRGFAAPERVRLTVLGSVDFLVSDSRNKLTRASYASCRTIFPPQSVAT